MNHWQRFSLFALISCLSLLLLAQTSVATAEPPAPAYQAATYEELMNEFGYGVSVLPWTAPGLAGFDWKKVYLPPSHRLPNHILYRVKLDGYYANPSDYTAEDAYRLAFRYGNFIEAYEIGNEVNLNKDGWEKPPNAAEYAALLCRVAPAIKAADPNAIIVSAGLAPTGRILGDWQGHAGHNGDVQDEREYLREFIAAGGADCADVIGYHPVGFRADFDAIPDLDGGNPETNCLNGFCFRGVEKIREILVEHGYEDKKIWATEMGWLREPYSYCLGTSSWKGRGWQTVAPQAQADNLVGAFQYAQEQWPWMGAMFIFNYNFSEVRYYWYCEHMRSYSIKNQFADVALKQMNLPYRHFMPLVPRRMFYYPLSQ